MEKYLVTVCLLCLGGAGKTGFENQSDGFITHVFQLGSGDLELVETLQKHPLSLLHHVLIRRLLETGGGWERGKVKYIM